MDEPFEFDPTGVSAPFPGETRAQACRRWAAEDEAEEDPVRAAREASQIAALQDEELFVADLSRKSLESLPTAVRQLFKRNPSNPRLRALYDQLTVELYARTDDVLRGALIDSVEEIVSLIDSGDPAVRLRASTYVFERLRGKTPEVIEHRQDKPFQVVLERLVTGPRIAADRLTDLDEAAEPLEAEIVLESDSGPKAERPALERARPSRKQRKTGG
jgi:hypothetical protein